MVWFAYACIAQTLFLHTINKFGMGNIIRYVDWYIMGAIEFRYDLFNRLFWSGMGILIHNKRVILSLRVKLGAFFSELLGLLLHSLLEGFLFREVLGSSVFADVFADFHGAEVGAAHGAEVG